MTQVGDEIVVSWNDGCLRQLIEGDQWLGFNPRQKQLWLTEMNSERNMRTQIRLLLQQQLTELFFQRRCEDPSMPPEMSCFIAGKWVSLLHFQDVVDEARKFI